MLDKYMYRITAVMKVETGIITSITVSLIGGGLIMFDATLTDNFQYQYYGESLETENFHR